MSRTLLLLDITAMGGDATCIAGVDLKAGKTVRLSDPQPTIRLLNLFAGLLPGQVVEVDSTPIRKAPAPHMEDHQWKPHSLKKTRRSNFPEIVEAVRRDAFGSTEEAFGQPALTKTDRKAAWKPGAGKRSLATIRVRNVELALSAAGRPRLSFQDETGRDWQEVAFQDLCLRQHAAACSSCANSYLKNAQEEFGATEALIRIGLTRPYAPDDESEPVCWLQVTNVLSKPREHFL